jgi:nicotinamidase-related amidase
MVTQLDKNTALVLIDLQNGVVGLPLVHPVKSVLANAAKLAAAFRKASLPVIIINVNPAGAAWTKTRRDVRPSGGVFNDDWMDIVPEITPHYNDIFITKHTWGAFYETELDTVLKKRDVTGLVLAGISTSIGVEGTARQASEKGYNLAFAKDAMTDMSADSHDHSLFRIFPRIGEIGTTEEIVSQLNRQQVQSVRSPEKSF